MVAGKCVSVSNALGAVPEYLLQLPRGAQHEAGEAAGSVSELITTCHLKKGREKGGLWRECSRMQKTKDEMGNRSHG